jgi:hypothetical protein
MKPLMQMVSLLERLSLCPRGNSSTTPAVFPQSEQRNVAFDFRRNHRNPMIPGDITAPPCLL